MDELQGDIFGFASEQALTGQEQAQGLARLRAHIQEHPLESAADVSLDDSMIESVFRSCLAVTLAPEERTTIRENLRKEQEALTFFAPAHAEGLGELEQKAVFSDLERRMSAPVSASSMTDKTSSTAHTWSWFSLRWIAPVCSAVLLIGAGAGISYAAEQALPGEFLYMVKRAHEQIRSGLYFSPKSKAENEAAKVERRMQEAKKLQEKQQLSESVSSTLAQDFRLERRRAVVQIQILEAQGDAEAAARIRARLNAVEDQFFKISGRERDEEGDDQESNKKYPTVKDESSLLSSVSSFTSSRSSSQTSTVSSTDSSVEVYSEVTSTSEGGPVKGKSTVNVRLHQGAKARASISLRKSSR